MRLLGDEGDTRVMAAGYVMAAVDFEVWTEERRRPRNESCRRSRWWTRCRRRPSGLRAKIIPL
ncbi:hypothetical protein Shyhy01_75220 [Streptomyces hygroscopicus subsp. hygroscopicus]|nr:hypothetical protein Shyhy01_75220 [Streptomyces hygroscopicus subsp. hygroscopicus]